MCYGREDAHWRNRAQANEFDRLLKEKGGAAAVAFAKNADWYFNPSELRELQKKADAHDAEVAAEASAPDPELDADLAALSLAGLQRGLVLT